MAVEIHDRQRLMDPSPVHTTPHVEEEDEWGMIIQFCAFVVCLAREKKAGRFVRKFGSLFIYLLFIDRY